jgi:tetratricopeptide (TPR) repeat protein
MPLLRCRFVLILLVTLSARGFSQSSSTRIANIAEPPELTGEPAKLKEASEADKQIFELVGHLKNEEETKATLPKLDAFIMQHPDYSDAYFLRATCLACILGSRDFAAISNDLNEALSHPQRAVYNDADYYSLLAKIEFASSKYEQAMTDLQKAMSRDLSTADRMFNIEGVEPQRESKFCIWNLADLDTFVEKLPKDYRGWLFRGLYYKFFTTFKEDYYSKALEQFQKAALLNSKSPVPQYFIGALYTKTSFWTKKAWASDAARDEAVRNSLQPYAKAIQLDPKFVLAYEARASAYLNLKQYPQAIKDFDKVLELDPEKSSAYSDRGLAHLEMRRYLAAIGDFDSAIQRKDPGDSFLSSLYEYRGDANVAMSQYREAIVDYSKAIERRLATEIFLLSLKQIRDLYPEYDNVSDEVLCRKLNALFYPAMKYADFSKQLLEENGKWEVSLLNDLYEKRGDTYLKSSNFRRGVLDFNRIYKGIPNFASSTDRWRLLGGTENAQYYLDVKTAEFPANGPVRIWIKAAGKKETHTSAYEMDCKSKRLNITSTVTYDANGNLLNSSDQSSGWQGIIPDTIGEQFYNGACSAGR